MRALYTLLWYVALPWLPLRLWWRGRREPGYRVHFGERFGRYAQHPSAPGSGPIWIHAVSLGETRAAAPLLARIERELPDATILLTHMTATGRAAGRTLYGDRVVQAWLPYDVPFAVRAFVMHFAPRAGLLMETEVWPNLLATCADRDVPVYLVNARLSARSLAGYRRFASLSQPMFASLAGVAAQTGSDATRLTEAGARDVVVTGNLKFDVDIAAAALELGGRLRARFGKRRPVWLAASTREGEEALLLAAIARGALPPHTLTVIVPRHPQRFDAVAHLLNTRGITFVRRSADAAVPEDVDVVLGDTLGELPAYYVAADVAFVGGSLLPLGGQNLMESIVAGVATIVGPHTFNFAEATNAAVAAGAARRVDDADALVREVAALLDDAGRRARMREASLALHAAHRGATDRLWAWLAPKLGSGPEPKPGNTGPVPKENRGSGRSA
ncbi:MAG: lipid IV(A) 3-deoxy-D-manno-octulosonic acid transferase [Burkholderiales bacterium]|nr:lipid IV(A) 3-deoxy-D-manno-octulosonic acid transferase [Burkholderiales bacterium]